MLAVAVGVVGIAAVDGRRAPAPRVDTDAACATCHAEEHSEWQTSRHALAWRDPIFQGEFAHGRLAWCVGCHAPLAPDKTAPDDNDPRVAQGVGCDACHRRDGGMVSSRRAADSPHATVVDPAFGSPAFCARCHQFNFPVLGERGRLLHYTDEPMQATVAEWRASGSEADCLDCHADRGHAFPGSHDPERVASALAIDLCATGDAIEVAIANHGAGHNVPSGGVHRRMVIRAWRSHAPERLAEYTLGRKFRPVIGGGKQTISDTTIAPGQLRTARFALAALGPPSPEINVELRYIYALDEHAALPTDVSRQIWFRRVAPSELARCVSADKRQRAIEEKKGRHQK